MNRKERRRFKKINKVHAILAGIPQGSRKIDRKNSKYCWLHSKQYEMEDFETTSIKKIGLEKITTIEKGISCPKCFNTVIQSKEEYSEAI